MDNETPAAASGNAQATARVFALRMTDEVRRRLTTKMLASEMPTPPGRRPALGAFLIWAGLRFEPRQLGGLDRKPPKAKRRAKPKAKRARRAGRRPPGRKGKRGRK